MKLLASSLLVLFLVGVAPSLANEEIKGVTSGLHEIFLNSLQDITKISENFGRCSGSFVMELSMTLQDLADDLISTIQAPTGNVIDAVVSLVPGFLGGNLMEKGVGKIRTCANSSDNNQLIRQSISGVFYCVKSKLGSLPAGGIDDLLKELQTHSEGVPGRLKALGDIHGISDIFGNGVQFAGSTGKALGAVLKKVLALVLDSVEVLPSFAFCFGKDVIVATGGDVINNTRSFVECMV